MPLRLVKTEEGRRSHTIHLDVEVERIIPLLRKGEPFTIDMWIEGIDPKKEEQVFDYLCDIHIPEDIGRMDPAEIRRLAQVIVAGAGF